LKVLLLTLRGVTYNIHAAEDAVAKTSEGTLLTKANENSDWKFHIAC
jgi:hypothetical protein